MNLYITLFHTKLQITFICKLIVIANVKILCNSSILEPINISCSLYFKLVVLHNFSSTGAPAALLHLPGTFGFRILLPGREGLSCTEKKKTVDWKLL